MAPGAAFSDIAKPAASSHKSKKKWQKSKHAVTKVATAGGAATRAAGLRPQTSQTAPGSRPNASVNSNWNGGTGNWGTGTAWTPNGVPNNGGGNTYNVTIGTGNDTVNLNLNATISSLTLGLSSGSSQLQNLAGSAESLNDTGVLTINAGGQLLFQNASSLTVGGGGSNAGRIELDQGSTANITGTFTNTGTIETNARTNAGGTNTFTVTGALTNNAGATINLGQFNDTSDVVNAGSLTNSGRVTVGQGATFNLTAQPNGLTDVVAGSEFDLYGTFKAGAASGLAKLAGVEGLLYVANNQATTMTPGGGTLTVSNTGLFDLDRAANVTISGNLTNSGQVNTNRLNYALADTLTVTGTLTNNAGGQVIAGFFNDSADVLNVGTLSNSGLVTIGQQATLNLTSQPNGITDVVAGSEFDVFGNFKAGAASALAKLGSVEGTLYVANNQSTTITPGGGTLTVNNTGLLDVDRAANVTISGNLTNSGQVDTNRLNYALANMLTVTGTLTNNAGGQVAVGFFNDSADVLNVGTLANSGLVSIGQQATLKLTSQPNGITDVVGGSEFDVYGNFKAGAASALAKLGSIEGILYVANNQSTTITPGGGTQTVSNTGLLDVDRAANVTISGSLTNSGQVDTNRLNYALADTLTVTGALTNNAGGQVVVGFFNDSADVLNVGTLSNSGLVTIGQQATLKLTNQPNGITDVVAGSEFDVYGNFKAGTANALAKLGSAEGTLYVANNQSTTITPGGGTLTVSNTGLLDVDRAANVTISGNLTNSGQVDTNRLNYALANKLTVTGTLINNAGGQVAVGFFNDSADVLNVGTLSNSGLVTIGQQAALNLTNQPSGITDVVAGSEFDVFGTFKAGTASALAKLRSLEGTLYVANNQSTTITPGGGTLTVSNTGIFDVDRSANVTISGSLTNSGQVDTNRLNYQLPNTLSVTGTVTNKAGATLEVGFFNDSADLMNAGILSNSGSVILGTGSTLNLTSSGTDTNSSTISLTGSTLKVSGANVTMSGNGTISLSNAANNLITGGASGVILTTTNTIQGSGTISNMGIVNTGTISANQSTPLLILPNSAGLNNQGTLSVSTGDTMQIGTSSGGALVNFASNTLTGGTYSVSGTMQFGAPGTSIMTDAANITLTGSGSQMIDFGGGNVLANLATIATGSSFTLGTGRSFTTAGNFANNGTLTVGGGDKFKVNGNLTNFSGTTLTGGTYKVTGTLQFNNANIVTNAANITLTGANSKIVDQHNTNALTNFATNVAGASFTLGTGRSFTTIGNFTNNGRLTVGSGDSFVVNGNLTNFSGTTLTGGTYSVSGTLQFNGANIVTNAANLTLASTTAKIVNQSAVNALAGFTTNAAAGSFTLSGNSSLTTNGGSFTNAGLFTVSKGSTFTVGGSGFNFTQTAGTTTVDGTLSGAGSGALNLNGGTLLGAGSLGYSVVDAATLTPGDSATKTGALAVSGTYAQVTAGSLGVTIGGTTPGTQYDQLNVSSTANLNGTLNISLASGFTPTIGSTFDILNASSVSGTFSTVNGLSINSSEHFTITYQGNDVILTVVSGAATPAIISSRPRPGLYRPGLHGISRGYGIALYRPVARPFPIPAVTTQPRPGFSAHTAHSRGFHRADFSPAAYQPASIAASPAALGYRGQGAASTMPQGSPAGIDHMRFECGLDVNALLKTSPKRLLRSLWASPDSPNAVSIGYMTLTPSR